MIVKVNEVLEWGEDSIERDYLVSREDRKAVYESLAEEWDEVEGIEFPVFFSMDVSAIDEDEIEYAVLEEFNYRHRPFCVVKAVELDWEMSTIEQMNEEKLK